MPSRFLLSDMHFKEQCGTKLFCVDEQFWSGAEFEYDF